MNDNNVYSFILRYQSHIDSISKSLKCVCSYYELFALEKEFQIFTIDDCLIYNFVTSELLVISNINSCGIFDDSICLYLIYKKLFSLEK